MKRIYALLMAVVLLLALTGCRSRTTAVVPGASEQEASSGLSESLEVPEQGPNQAAEKDVPEEPPKEQEAEPDPNAPTEEDPESDRKEYDENASAEIAPGADNVLQTEGEEENVSGHDPSAEQGGNKTDDQAEHTVTETVPAEEADQTGVADDAEIADTAIYYYQTLLSDRLSSLFECQRLYIYWETPESYRTVFKTSQEHQLILDAGAYDVSAKLLEENLTVDDGWVQRKNPGAIVKVVSSQVLGYDVSGTSAAQGVWNEMISRHGWNEIDAVKNGCVIVLSEDMLDSQAMRTAAAVHLAKILYPAQFEDVDPAEALRALSEEATGHAASGTFVFVG